MSEALYISLALRRTTQALYISEGQLYMIAERHIMNMVSFASTRGPKRTEWEPGCQDGTGETCHYSYNLYLHAITA